MAKPSFTQPLDASDIVTRECRWAVERVDFPEETTLTATVEHTRVEVSVGHEDNLLSVQTFQDGMPPERLLSKAWKDALVVAQRLVARFEASGAGSGFQRA